MQRFIVACVALLALTACSTPSPTEEFLDEMHSTGLVPTLGSDGDALGLAESICQRLDAGDTVSSQVQNLRDNGFNERQAGIMMDAAVVNLCPRHST